MALNLYHEFRMNLEENSIGLRRHFAPYRQIKRLTLHNYFHAFHFRSAYYIRLVNEINIRNDLECMRYASSIDCFLEKELYEIVTLKQFAYITALSERVLYPQIV